MEAFENTPQLYSKICNQRLERAVLRTRYTWNMYRYWLPFTLAALSSIAFAQASAKAPALDKTKLESYVRHIFAWGAPIQVQIADPRPSEALPGFREVDVTASAGQASQAVTFYLSEDGRRLIQGSVFDTTKNPYENEVRKIKTDLQPSFGAPGASVVLVVYSDFQCGYCKEEANLLRQNVASAYPNDVRVYFKDFPLMQIHPWAKPAAIAGRCIFRQKPVAFWDYHDWIFAHQGEITPENLKSKVEEFAKSKGLEPIGLSACIETRATEPEVDRSMTEARTVGVNSTPTMFINGRRVVGNVPWPQLKNVIDHEIEYAKAHGGGEKCCEIKLPSAVQ